MSDRRRQARRVLGRVICAVLDHEPLLTEPGERRLEGLEDPPGRVNYAVPCRYCGRMLWNIDAFSRRLAEEFDASVRAIVRGFGARRDQGSVSTRNGRCA